MVSLTARLGEERARREEEAATWRERLEESSASFRTQLADETARGAAALSELGRRRDEEEARLAHSLEAERRDAAALREELARSRHELARAQEELAQSRGAEVAARQVAVGHVVDDYVRALERCDSQAHSLTD